MLYKTISFYAKPYCIVQDHLILYKPYYTIQNHLILYKTTLYYTTPFHPIQKHITSCKTVSYYTKPYHTIQNHIISYSTNRKPPFKGSLRDSHCFLQNHIILYKAILYYTKLDYTISCYTRKTPPFRHSQRQLMQSRLKPSLSQAPAREFLRQGHDAHPPADVPDVGPCLRGPEDHTNSV